MRFTDEETEVQRVTAPGAGVPARFGRPRILLNLLLKVQVAKQMAGNWGHCKRIRPFAEEFSLRVL